MGFDSPFGSWMPHVLSVRIYLDFIELIIDMHTVIVMYPSGRVFSFTASDDVMYRVVTTHSPPGTCIVDGVIVTHGRYVYLEWVDGVMAAKDTLVYPQCDDPAGYSKNMYIVSDL